MMNKYICSTIIIIIIFIINYILFFKNEIYDYNSFNELYNKTWNIVLKKVENCEISKRKCKNIKDKYNDRNKSPDETKSKYKGQFPVLIHPKIKNDSDVVVVIPVSPTELSVRVTIRHSYYLIKEVYEYKFTYIFIMGKPYKNKYPYNYTLIESNIFHDILMFDLINSYHSLSMLMLSTFNYLSNHFLNAKWMIRINGDASFLPNQVINLFDDKYDVIGQGGTNKHFLKKYPEGAFHIMSFKFIKWLYNISLNEYKPPSFADDVYYGRIIQKYNISHLLVDDYIQCWCKKNECWENDKYIAFHPIPTPAILGLYLKHSHIHSFNKMLIINN